MLDTNPYQEETKTQARNRLMQTKASVKRMHRPERMNALVRGEAKVSAFWSRLVTL